MNAFLALLLACLPAPLVERLGAASYRQRAAAHRALAALGRRALPHLDRAVRSHPSPEVRARCGLLLGPYEYERAWELALRLRPRNWPRVPWLSCGDDATYHYLVAGRMHCDASRQKQGPPDWSEYRWATVEWVASQLRQRRPVDEILDALDRMATEERGWILQHGGNYSPPLKLPEGCR